MFDMAIQPERSGPIVAYARDPANAGKSRRQLARELGVHESLVRRSLATAPDEEPMKSKTKEEVLPVRSITLDPGIQPRAATDEKAVADYRRAYEKGGDLGLVVVFRDPDDGTTRVADGFHRLTAAGLAGLEKIRCEVRIGNRSACIAYALQANLRHTGIRFTRADKRRAVGIALSDPELAKRSDREIAEICGVSDKSVGKRRKESGAEIPHLNGQEKRVGRDGKEYPVKSRETQPTADDPAEADDGPGDESAPDASTQTSAEADLGPGDAADVEGDDAGDDDDLGDAYEGPDDPVAEASAKVRLTSPDAGPVEVERIGGDGPCKESEPEPSEDDLSDEEWLATLPARPKLADYPRRRFDRDALFYREFQPFLRAMRNASASLRKKYRIRNWAESYHHEIEWLLRGNAPKHWVYCKICNGTGQVSMIGQCAKCRGRGYFSSYVPRDQWEELP